MMRHTLAPVLLALLALALGPLMPRSSSDRASARDLEDRRLHVQRGADRSGLSDRPFASGAERTGTRTPTSGLGLSRGGEDVLSFGNVGPDGFAILGDIWTFDHGGADPFEGWFADDRTDQDGIYGLRIDGASWDSDPYNEVEAPVLSGQGSAWFGVFGTSAQSQCWSAGLGYGNRWCQRLYSPAMVQNGTSAVDVRWTFFNDSEDNFDYTRVYLEGVPSGRRTLLRRYTGQIGLSPEHPDEAPIGVADSVRLVPEDFAGETGFRIAFEMKSDGSWSDQDGLYETAYGPSGFDDVVVSGLGPGGNEVVSYAFESDLDGWTAEGCPGIGTFLGVAPSSDYPLGDLCRCSISGNVLEMHDDLRDHPEGQHVMAISAPVDVLRDVQIPGENPLWIWATFTHFLQLSSIQGVWVRPGWQYYPWSCGQTGEVGWSPRVGSTQEFFWSEAGCVEDSDVGTLDGAIPEDVEQVRFVYELITDCLHPFEDCTERNFTPLLDNVQIHFARRPTGPPISFRPGRQFQDGFAQGPSWNDPSRPGRADVTARSGGVLDPPPIILGDSLVVEGPAVPNQESRWEARLWFRIARVGPLAGGRYTIWRDQVQAARGVDIEAGAFAHAWMDSSQLGTNVYRNRFVSYLREDEWGPFGRTGPELSDATEILQDDVLFPGTKVEYFVSSRYLFDLGDEFLLPDTTGGFFAEFEILPAWRDVGGVLRYPCFLYIDADNLGAQHFVEAAWSTLGIAHDRYDYLDANSNWKAPLARGLHPLSNNGITLPQLLGYRGIVVHSGSSHSGQLFWPEDYLLMDDWLTALACGAGTASRQGLILNGDGIATNMLEDGASLLARMGAVPVADSYADYSGDEDDCVRVESPSGGGALYGTTNSLGDYEYDAWGNWCPELFEFDVLSPRGTGVGNRVFLDLEGMSETGFAQVVRAVSPEEGNNFRTVLDGVSWHHTAAPDPVRCERTEESIAASVVNELAAALEWIYEVDIGGLGGLCEDPCEQPVEIPEGGLGAAAATRLHAAAPNPFSPRVTLRFSMGADGEASLAVYDVAGRRVRTLVEGPVAAGHHEAVWDGTNDKGESVTSGAYWARLVANGYETASRLVLLR